MAFLQDMEEETNKDGEDPDMVGSTTVMFPFVSAAVDIQCYLWNPTTKQCKELPRFPRYAKALEGKDHDNTLSDDYKVASHRFKTHKVKPMDQKNSKFR